MDPYLKTLRELSLTFKIKPQHAIGNAAGIDTIIKVLSDVRRSFLGFVEVEFLRETENRNAYEKDKSILADFLKHSELLMVDVRFGSLQASVAPNVLELDNPLFKDELLKWKREKFNVYKHDVFGKDYNRSDDVRDILQNYSPAERAKIYRPVFDAVAGKHTIQVIDNAGRITNVLHAPDEVRRIQLLPPVAKSAEKPIQKNVVGYFKVLTDGTTVEWRKSNIKKVYDIDFLEHDDYPFKPDAIRHEHRTFVLKRKLVCDVRFEEDIYFISQEELNIAVWGKTREEAEAAFAFSFNALYENYVMEDEGKLSLKALELRSKIANLISKTYNES